MNHENRVSTFSNLSKWVGRKLQAPSQDPRNFPSRCKGIVRNLKWYLKS